MEFREFSAKTVSDCITDACTTFSVPSDRLEYEVLTEGSSGFIGIGVKQAKIKARVKDESFEEVEEARKKVKEIEDEKKAAAKKEKEEKEAAEKEAKKAAKVEEKKEDHKSDTASNEVINSTSENKISAAEAKPRRELTEEEQKEVTEKAVNFLTEVFKAMSIQVDISCSYQHLNDCFAIELSGEKMGILIGKRGQTLDSLQYLTSLVVNKGTSEYVRIKIDTENYRERRKETLENLAKNIAFKVKRTRRPVSLEPMNPYERRIIHSALQNDRYVTTHSEGEEPYRKVVVTLK